MEKKPELNYHYCEASSSTHDYHGKHYTFYYKTSNFNQRQQYHHDKTKKNSLQK